MLIWLALTASAREVVREGPRPSPPEAWFVLGGPTRCEVTVIVGADGLPLDARPENCPDVLATSLVEAAMRWRWSRAPSTTTEEVEIPIAPPEFSPRGGKDGCLVGFEAQGTEPVLLSEPSRRCAVEPGPLPVIPSPDRRAVAWCAVDIVADADGVRALEVDGCAEGYEAPTAQAVRSWRFPTDRERRWRVLVGYPPGE